MKPSYHRNNKITAVKRKCSFYYVHSLDHLIDHVSSTSHLRPREEEWRNLDPLILLCIRKYYCFDVLRSALHRPLSHTLYIKLYTLKSTTSSYVQPYVLLPIQFRVSICKRRTLFWYLTYSKDLSLNTISSVVIGLQKPVNQNSE